MGAVGPGGLLLIDKPQDITSFKVVDHVRRLLLATDPALTPARGPRGRGQPRPPRFKCGHAGTLDPMATGLLIVLVGKGSRLSPFLLGQDKTYAATISFGVSTDTLDRMGQPTEQAPVPPTPVGLEEVLEGFRGPILQVPPLISALKKDGQPLYKRVRLGQEVEEPAARPVTIRQLELQAVRWGLQADGTRVHEADLRVHCSSGTYVRSLARDVAQAWDTVGHLSALRRLDIGPFAVSDAVTGVLAASGEELLSQMLPLSAALPQTPTLVLNIEEAEAIRQGGQPGPDWLMRLDTAPVVVGKSAPLFRLVDGAGDLVAVGRLDETGTPATALVIPRTSPNKDDETCD
jgi:tRNA pseudouridine55 synthase